MNHALWVPWNAPEPGRPGKHDHEYKSFDVGVMDWDNSAANYPWGGVSWAWRAWRSDVR